MKQNNVLHDLASYKLQQHKFEKLPGLPAHGIAAAGNNKLHYKET